MANVPFPAAVSVIGPIHGSVLGPSALQMGFQCCRIYTHHRQGRRRLFPDHTGHGSQLSLQDLKRPSRLVCLELFDMLLLALFNGVAPVGPLHLLLALCAFLKLCRTSLALLACVCAFLSGFAGSRLVVRFSVRFRLGGCSLLSCLLGAIFAPGGCNHFAVFLNHYDWIGGGTRA